MRSVRLPILALACVVTVVPAMGQTSRRPHLLIPGASFGGGDSLLRGQQWWGLYRATAGGYEVRPAAVRVEQVDEPCKSNHIVTDDSTPPVVLFSAVPGLRRGPVDTVFSGSRFLHPGESVSWQMGQRWFALRAVGAAAETESGALFTGYRLRLATSENQYATPQTIAKLDFTLENTPQILWAGDLDGDGRLDLFVRLPGGGYGGDFRLYLSSIAHSPNLVGEAGRFFVSDC